MNKSGAYHDAVFTTESGTLQNYSELMNNYSTSENIFAIVLMRCFIIVVTSRMVWKIIGEMQFQGPLPKMIDN